MANLKFQDVCDRCIRKLEESGTSRLTIRDHISSFKTYLKKGFNINISDVIDCDFEGLKNFEALANKKCKEIWGEKTWRGKKSRIKKFYKSYIEISDKIEADKLPENFPNRLKYFIELRKISIKKLSTHVKKASEATIHGWVHGKHFPTYKKVEAIKEIEDILDCKGLLLKSINKASLLGARNVQKAKRMKSEQAKKNLFASVMKYGFPFSKWPHSLKLQWEKLVVYHTAECVEIGMTRSKGNIWKSKNTVSYELGLIIRYFGFLILKPDRKKPWLSGKGLEIDELSIALLSDPLLIKNFILFLKERSKYGLEKNDNKYEMITLRSKGVFTNTVKKMLILCKSLVKPNGYLRQVIDLKKTIKITNYITDKSISWNKWCDQAYFEFQKYLDFDFEQTRDTKERVRALWIDGNKKKILTYYLPKLINSIQCLLPANPSVETPKTNQIIWARRLIIVSIYYCIPLRANQVRLLEIDKHLIKYDGDWYWDLKKETFKNKKYLSDDFFSKCPSWFGNILDSYISHYRPLSVCGKEDSNECKYLLRPVLKHQSLKSLVSPISKTLLYSDMIAATNLLNLPNCHGWGNHLFRLLIGTGAKALQKDHGETFSANILLDKEGTVKKHYIAEQIEDDFEEYNNLTSQFMSEQMQSHDADNILIEIDKLIKSKGDPEDPKLKKLIDMVDTLKE